MLSIVLEAAIRSLVLGFVAWILLACFRVKNPITRLTVWTGMLYVAVAMPLLVVARYALLPALPVLQAMPDDAMTIAPASLFPAMPSGAGVSPGATEVAPFHPWPVILPLYAGVTLLLLLRLAFGLIRGWALKRRAVPLGGGLYRSDDVSAPLVFGSAIILPADSGDWPEVKRVAVLAHEESHIARGDFYVQLLSAVHRAVFCFSPLGWWLHRQLATLAELASDDAAAEAHGDRLSYAEILIEVARDARPVAGAVAMARGPAIAGRIARLVSGAALSAKLSHRQRAMIVGAGMIAVLCALTVTVASTSAAEVGSRQNWRHFAPLIRTLATLDRGPARLAAAVGGMLQDASPSLAAPPASEAAPPVQAGPVPLGPVPVGAGQVANVNGARWADQNLYVEDRTEGVPTLGEIKAMPAQLAGDRVLGALKHGAVATVEKLGFSDAVELVEQWTAVAEGCQRLRWTATFRRVPDAQPESARLNRVTAVAEIGLAGRYGCIDVRSAVLGVGVDRDTGFRLLSQVEVIAAGKGAATFDCQGRSISCDNDQMMRAELIRPAPRRISMINGLGTVSYYNAFATWGPSTTAISNAPYLRVKLDPAKPGRVTVEEPPNVMRRGINAQNTPDAAEILAELSDPASIYLLGHLYLTGQGVAKDEAKGVALYRKAAAAGYSPAMLGLAEILERGSGIASDKAELDNWYRRWAREDDKLYTPETRARVLAEHGLKL